MKINRTEKGYTLIESIALIGIMTMVAISVISLINSMLDKYRISRITQQIIELQKSIDVRYSASANCTGLTVGRLIREKLTPADMVDGNTLKHAFGGNVQVGVFTGTNASGRYVITFSDVPSEACVELAMIDWVSGYTSRLAQLQLNGRVFFWKILQGNNSRFGNLPMTVDTAVSICSTTEKNNLRWIFH